MGLDPRIASIINTICLANLFNSRLIFKYGDNPVEKHKDLLIRKLKPVFEKRQRDMKQHGNEWTGSVSKFDYQLISYAKTINYGAHT